MLPVEDARRRRRGAFVLRTFHLSTDDRFGFLGILGQGRSPAGRLRPDGLVPRPAAGPPDASPRSNSAIGSDQLIARVVPCQDRGQA
jgi:hypothetical protein